MLPLFRKPPQNLCLGVGGQITVIRMVIPLQVSKPKFHTLNSLQCICPNSYAYFNIHQRDLN